MSRSKSSMPFKVDLLTKTKTKNLMTNEDDEKTTKSAWDIYKQYIPYGGGVQAIIVLNSILIA